jgi:hypothetical protein
MIELFLRNKLIQSKLLPIQCVPNFDKDQSNSDVLMFTNRNMTKNDFNAYQFIFKGLGLKPSYWDVDYHNGLSYQLDTNQSHEISWIDKFKGKSILLNSESEDFFKITPSHLYSHFDQKDSMETSGFVIFGCDNPNQIISHSFKDSELTEKVEEAKFSDKYTFTSPTIEQMTSRCEEIQHEYCKLNPLYKYKVKGEFKPYQVGDRVLLTYKYCFGNAYVYRLAIPVTDSFITMSEQKIYVPMGSEKISISTNSTLFKVIFGVLMSLSFSKKLELLAQNFDNHPWEFFNHNTSKKKTNLRSVIIDSIHFHLLKHYNFSKLETLNELINYFEKKKKLFHKNGKEFSFIFK